MWAPSSRETTYTSEHKELVGSSPNIDIDLDIADTDVNVYIYVDNK